MTEQTQEAAEQTTETQLTPHQQFLEMLPEDLRSDPSFIKFDGESPNAIIGNLAKSYTNLQKLVGADKNAIIKFPSSEDDKEGWEAIYSKLGRPETVEGYEIEKLKELGEEMDEGVLKGIAEAAHANGVSKKAFEAIVGKYMEQFQGMKEQSAQQAADTEKQYVEALQKEWGEAFEPKMAKVLNTLKEKADPEFLKMAADYPFIFDHPSVLKTIDNLLKMSSEDSGPKQAGASNGALTPAEAKAQIAAFMADEQKQKILNTQGHPMRESVMAEKSRLFKAANP